MKNLTIKSRVTIQETIEALDKTDERILHPKDVLDGKSIYGVPGRLV